VALPGQQSQTAEAIKINRPRTWGRSLLAVARRKPLGTAGAVVTLLLILTAIFAPVIAPFDPYDFNLTEKGLPLRREAPNGEFLFGTDALGRDVLSRIIYGARVSLLVGFLSVAVGTALGTAIGLASGYWEGKVDQVLQRIVDTFMSFPGIVLALAVVAVLGQSLINIILVISIVIAPGTSRVVRGAVLAIKQNVYIDAARSIGASDLRIVIRHVLPNVVAPVIIIATVWIGNAIVIEAALSFLGLGTPPPTPTWGGMLAGEGQRNLENAPWLAIFPGLAISIVVLSFNMLGDALRDVLDPRLRTR
jgi:peptide/nickel transport system permease protein